MLHINIRLIKWFADKFINILLQLKLLMWYIYLYILKTSVHMLHAFTCTHTHISHYICLYLCACVCLCVCVLVWYIDLCLQCLISFLQKHSFFIYFQNMSEVCEFIFMLHTLFYFSSFEWTNVEKYERVNEWSSQSVSQSVHHLVSQSVSQSGSSQANEEKPT